MAYRKVNQGRSSRFQVDFYIGGVELAHPRGARIVRNSHFTQIFKLGYKILLVCVARGNPRPQFKWFKDGAELDVKRNTHLYSRSIGPYVTKSKVQMNPINLSRSISTNNIDKSSSPFEGGD